MPEAIQFVPYVLVVLLTGIPTWKLLVRVGLSPAWAVLCLIPAGFIIVLWLIAYRRWPLLEE
jgi:hypothetical protein